MAGRHATGRRVQFGFVAMGLALVAVAGQLATMSATPVQAYNLLPWRWQPRSSAISWDYSCNAPWGPGGGCANWVQPQQQPAWQYWTNRTVDAANRWAKAIAPLKVYLYQHQSGQGSTADVYVGFDTNPADPSGTGGCNDYVNGYCQRGSGFATINTASDYSNTTTVVFNTYGVMHELGHAMGLDHSCSAGSVMQGPASPCPGEPYACLSKAPSDNTSCPSQPTVDDVNGIAALYPSGTGGPGYYVQCDVGGVCQQSPTKPPLSASR